MAKVLRGTGKNGDMTSLGSRSRDSSEWFGHLFATSSEGEDTVLVRTHIPFLHEESTLQGSWREFRLQESLGFLVCNRLWSVSVMSIVSAHPKHEEAFMAK